MSDRCVFMPCRGFGSEPSNYEWADVVILESATSEEVHQAAAKFARLPGPHHIFVADRNDPRFVEFCEYLDDEYAMLENAHWGFSVSVDDR